MTSERQGYSYLVPAGTMAEVQQRARLAMIADGRAPGTTLYVGEDPSGPDLIEVVLTDEPLESHQSFLANGQRAGMTGGKAFGRGARNR